MDKKCNICPRYCNINRDVQKGFCLAPSQMIVSHVMAHMWEEPFISGTRGSGTIFFSGCNLKCVFCQNHTISHKLSGRIISEDELYKIILRLADECVHNINFVTAAHFTDRIIPVLKKVKKEGINIPIIWNSSGYESKETLEKLEGLVDVYLPDFKYMDPGLSLRYSKAEDYPAIAKTALDEMFRQTGPVIIEKGLIKKGMVVRHLILPGLKEDSKDILDYLSSRFKKDILISIMNQYYSAGDLSKYPEINRTLTDEEFDDVIDYALFSGVTNAMTQSEDSRSASYTPDFTGISLEFLDK